MSKDLNAYLPCLSLKNIPGVGNILYKRLMNQFGSAESVFKASDKDLCRIRGLTARAMERILTFKECSRSKYELDRIQRFGLQITTMTDQDYPTLLKEIPDPPPVLTYKGRLDNEAPCIAIVGSRRPTSYGLETAFRLGSDLARTGFQVVSGMARGIDTAAHKGALKAGGQSLAILGCGLDTIYPPENKGLFADIQKQGAVISEFGINTRPEPRNFPIRNRIIAGISTGSVIVEAADKSGSLITARLTAEYNREVFAVPGSIRSAKSRGTHSLLKQGATLVEKHTDIIEQLHHLTHTVSTPEEKQKGGRTNLGKTFSAGGPHTAVLDTLGPYPHHIDTIISKSGLEPGTACAALLDLELQGIVRQSPGKNFAIIEE